MLKIIKILRKVNLLSTKMISILTKEIYNNGINIGSITRIGAQIYPNRIAFSFNKKDISYIQLYKNVKALANCLHTEYGLNNGQKIVLICSNHPALIYTIFAAGYLGMNINLIHLETTESQLEKLLTKNQFDFIIYDAQKEEIVHKFGYKDKSLVSYSETQKSVDQSFTDYKSKNFNYKRHFTGAITVLTAGTTGIPKIASRKVGISAFISPFVDLVEGLQLTKYKSLYLATPIYHGFGICALLISFTLGKKLYISQYFDALEACEVIKDNAVEAITLVPTMLQRMIIHPEYLISLQCIISGGAALPRTLVEKVQQLNHHILYNLYGASEAGFCIMASPEDLQKSPSTIGRPIRKVRVAIVDKHNREVQQNEIGEIMIQCKWSVDKDNWIKTGDVGYVDDRGYYYLMRRSDDMIVSGGENVYSCELENIIRKHSSIREVAVVGVPDKEFGQRLKAFIVVEGATTSEALFDWLQDRVARYQMPRDIIFIEKIPLTPIGKLDKKVLKTL